VIVEDMLGVEDAIRIIRESLDLYRQLRRGELRGSDAREPLPARHPALGLVDSRGLDRELSLGLTSVPQWDAFISSRSRIRRTR
jgi:hypothetical protein